MIIQREPTKSLSYLNTLISLSKKKNRKQSENAISAVRDLFTLHGLLKDDRKLFTFSKNPLIVGKKEHDIKDKDLLEAYIEH